MALDSGAFKDYFSSEKNAENRRGTIRTTARIGRQGRGLPSRSVWRPWKNWKRNGKKRFFLEVKEKKKKKTLTCSFTWVGAVATVLDLDEPEEKKGGTRTACGGEEGRTFDCRLQRTAAGNSSQKKFARGRGILLGNH